MLALFPQTTNMLKLFLLRLKFGYVLAQKPQRSCFGFSFIATNAARTCSQFVQYFFFPTKMAAIIPTVPKNDLVLSVYRAAWSCLVFYIWILDKPSENSSVLLLSVQKAMKDL